MAEYQLPIAEDERPYAYRRLTLFCHALFETAGLRGP